MKNKLILSRNNNENHIKSKDKRFINNLEKEYMYSLVVLLSVYAIFNVLLINKFFPITEGWFQEYAMYINNGQIMYKDFYMFIPPGFPLLISILGKIVGNTFIFFRIYGLIERLVLVCLVFIIFKRIFKPAVCFIAVLSSSVIYIANIQDVFYGYYQTSLLLGILCVYFCIKMYERFEYNPYIYAALLGLSSAISFLFKQTLGMGITFAICVMFFVCTYFKSINKSIKCIAIIMFTQVVISLFFIIILYNSGIWSMFFEQVFMGTSSKGSIVSILFGFFARIVPTETIFLVVIFGIYFVIYYTKNELISKDKFNTSNKIVINIIEWALFLIISLCFFMKIISSFQTREVIAPLIEYDYSKQSIVFFLMIFFIASLVMFYFNERPGFNKYGILILGICISSGFIFISKNQISYINFHDVREYRQYFIYSIFFIEIIYSIFLLYSVSMKRKTEYSVKLIITVASWAIMYIHGFSVIIEDHSVIMSLALFIGIILNNEMSLNRIKNIMVLVFVMIMMFTVCTQRNWFTYNWWGVGTTAPTYNATESFDDPLLFGIYTDKNSATNMNEIYRVVNSNKILGDTMYTFPHINYFNVMSNLKSPTFSKVHYFDVCPDNQALDDAKIILESKPNFIVWMDLPEDVWSLHEEIFRGGELSGQRELKNAYSELTLSGEYILIGEYSILNSDPIFIWILNDGRDLKI